jgi:hypothetical protein
MKKQFLYFAVAGVILLLSINSCSTQHKSVSARQYKKNFGSAFVERFKTLSFCRCVEYGNNSARSLQAEDASCRYPDYLYGVAGVIDSLGLIESKKIKADSTDRSGRVAEGMEGRRVIGKCLEFYKGKELDAIARSRYRANRKAAKNLRS